MRRTNVGRRTTWIAIAAALGFVVGQAAAHAADNPAGAADARKHLVLVISEPEYETETTLPKFAQEHLARDFRMTVVLGTEGKKAPFELKGIEALDDADVALFSLRRRAVPAAQMDVIRKYLSAGKPLVAIRTTTHAFDIRKETPPEGYVEWKEFDRDVIGCEYEGHYGKRDDGGPNSTVWIADKAAGHPILAGWPAEKVQFQSWLYKSRDLGPKTTVLLMGRAGEGEPEEPSTWTNERADGGRVFYTMLGHKDDFAQVSFQRLLTNGVYWAAGLPIPGAEEKKTASTPESSENKDSLEPPPVLSPSESLKAFTVPDDLRIDLVLAEPDVMQPVFFNFDERGRMWVVEYLQYPNPEGLKRLSRDKHWRSVYDKVPLAPPHHERGQDRISIHTDTDGDGVYDAHTIFVDGLNIASACERGRGGVWVLNPPYLLFYPDRDNDDVPDGDPEVHLAGFGIEDTHSVVNSLRFGPDGWLYAAQGSTVTGHVSRPGQEKLAVHSLGQLIWRYHPETRRYEIFAEGGGNAFGVELDSAGRIFSGHNGGDTRGFHYVQGGYYRKGFEKHGGLSNPFTLGYFEPMGHHTVPRFTHNFVIYDGAALPQQYDGHLFGIEPLQGTVVLAKVERDGSTYKTTDLSRPITTTDKRFRPVDIKVGPDGAIYVADMYEAQIAHLQHFAGNIDKSNGRIYRLTAKDANPRAAFDLNALSTAELVDRLADSNKWFRQSALRLIGDRRDASIVPLLKERIAAGRTPLESLWALDQVGGLDESTSLELLGHADPQVRLWTARFIGDAGQPSPEVAARLVEIASSETDVQVRGQLASTARRLRPEAGLTIVRQLINHDEDVADPHVPLLIWWAIEANCEKHRDRVLATFRDASIWSRPMARTHLLSRLMQRFAQAGARKDLVTCAELFGMSPDAESTDELMKGFEAAFQGRSLSGMPIELAEALAKAGGGSLTLRIRQKDAAAIDEALEFLTRHASASGTAPSDSDRSQIIDLVQTFGEVDEPRATPVLVSLLTNVSDDAVRTAVLASLQRASGDDVGKSVVELYAKWNPDVQSVAQTLLVSRPVWTKALLSAVESGQIPASAIPLDVVRKMTIHRDPEITALVAKHWSNVEGASSAEMQAEIARLRDLLTTDDRPDPYAGEILFEKTCAKCHLLFGKGGRIGPDLTSHKRDDLLNLLINVVNPSAEVREGFETFIVVTTDGRTATGFLTDQDNQVIVLRGSDGQSLTIPRDEIDELLPEKKSIMPEGLLKDLSEPQIRDLFAYLRAAQPLP